MSARRSDYTRAFRRREAWLRKKLAEIGSRQGAGDFLVDELRATVWALEELLATKGFPLREHERNPEAALSIPKRTAPTLRTPQYWLAELDQYDSPTLIDGSHNSAEDCNRAAYLIREMHLGNPNRRFAVAKVQLFPCEPTDRGVNHEAIALINELTVKADA